MNQINEMRSSARDGDEEGVAVAVVVELVVRRHRQQRAEARPQRVEDLRGGLVPNLTFL